MAHFLLVHGAWHAAWCWERLTPLLEGRGHTVIAPDLPSHGKDTSPKSSATLAKYVDHIVGIITEQPEPVILTGHSLAGVTISQVGENIPERISYLVYIAATLPRNREAADMYLARDSASEVPAAMEFGSDGLAYLKEGAATGIFYHRCGADDAAWASARLEAQSLKPTEAKLSLSLERFGSVPRAYILCTEDRAVTPGMQRQMMTNWACDPVFEIETDHSPFLSTPDTLAGHLDSVARRHAEPAG